VLQEAGLHRAAHTFWSMENGERLVTLIGMAFSSANAMAFSRVQA
jgi:hypothetical protein